MASVVGVFSFTRTHAHLYMNGMNHAVVAFPAEVFLISPTPEGWKAEST